MLYTHPLVVPWSMWLTVVGLREWLGVRPGWAWGLTLLSTALTIPLLAIFAAQDIGRSARRFAIGVAANVLAVHMASRP